MGDAANVINFCALRAPSFEVADVLPGKAASQIVDGIYPCGTLLIETYADHVVALFVIFFVKCLHAGHFAAARRTPGGPEVDEGVVTGYDHFLQVMDCACGVGHCEVEQGLGGDLGGGSLIGGVGTVLCGACRHANDGHCEGKEDFFHSFDVIICCKSTHFIPIGRHFYKLLRNFVGENKSYMMNTSDSIVIIPTYNERENIEAIIRAVLGLEPHAFNILVIDDGSPDGTAQIVKGLMAEEFADRLFLVERTGKLGLGTAYIAGFRWALEHGYDYIFEMDADFSHDPKDLPRLYEACHSEGNGVAVGSRYITGVNVVNWPIGRVLMSYYASAYVRTVLGVPLRDTTAGFVCYRREVLEAINLDAIRFKGYAFQIEMKYTALCLGYKVKEVPVIFVNRQLGTSKMSSGIFGEAFFGVMRLRLNKPKRK